jgi:hypothetical protein
MSPKMRSFASGAVSRLAALFGRKIIDARTGECVGRAFVRFRHGRVVLIGLRADRALYPVFKTQPRATYWQQEIEFRSHPEPDFADEPIDDQRDPDAPPR